MNSILEEFCTLFTLGAATKQIYPVLALSEHLIFIKLPRTYFTILNYLDSFTCIRGELDNACRSIRQILFHDMNLRHYIKLHRT